MVKGLFKGLGVLCLFFSAVLLSNCGPGDSGNEFPDLALRLDKNEYDEGQVAIIQANQAFGQDTFHARLGGEEIRLFKSLTNDSALVFFVPSFGTGSFRLAINSLGENAVMEVNIKELAIENPDEVIKGSIDEMKLENGDLQNLLGTSKALTQADIDFMNFLLQEFELAVASLDEQEKLELSKMISSLEFSDISLDTFELSDTLLAGSVHLELMDQMQDYQSQLAYKIANLSFDKVLLMAGLAVAIYTPNPITIAAAALAIWNYYRNHYAALEHCQITSTFQGIADDIGGYFRNKKNVIEFTDGETVNLRVFNSYRQTLATDAQHPSSKQVEVVENVNTFNSISEEVSQAIDKIKSYFTSEVPKHSEKVELMNVPDYIIAPGAVEYYSISNVTNGVTFNVSKTAELLQIVANGDAGKAFTFDVSYLHPYLGYAVNKTFNAKMSGGSGGGGETSTVDDYEGNTYNTVKIGTQWWMAENLNAVVFSNGDSIKNYVDNSDWVNAGLDSLPAWCFYMNNSGIGDTHGRLYNWYVASDDRNVCPEGWHVPGIEEFDKLTDYLGGDTIAGAKMKPKGYWGPPNEGAENESGFTALPSGGRLQIGEFYLIGNGTYYWNSSDYGLLNGGNCRILSSQHKGAVENGQSKYFGASIRCVKD